MTKSDITTTELGCAITALLNHYVSLSRKPPSLSKLAEELKGVDEMSIERFVRESSQAKRRVARKSTADDLPGALEERVHYFKVRLDAALHDPSSLDTAIEEVRAEAKSRKKGTLSLPGIEALYQSLTGAHQKFTSIDDACGNVRQRMLEMISAKQSYEYAQSHKAY